MVTENLIHNEKEILEEIRLYLKKSLEEAKIFLGRNYDIEVSHHYGVENFYKTGAVIVNLINREYCKKLIILFPDQKHPPHYHVKKEETFRLLHGDMKVRLDNEWFNLQLGDDCLIERGRIHSFKSKEGCIFEEISTHHHTQDSFYLDPSINKSKPNERKTYIDSL